ncbi:DUF5050 domain-containing protein [Crassaminicella indica]|uniref:DUF5050 domain-containing protein n=1 Tax=Crassaminicella indica TaxID=2855394 RepID=A0ABX8RA47_9CLOT|nr:DUF5050 domain-containing protein [Crassaminicella indica]QXM05923.1 DUF5050 domain-containing protein [Crassaminicella indica]
MKKFLNLVMFVCMVLVIGSTNISYSNEVNPVGYGNHLNKNNIVKNGEWIYYIEYENDDRLYKMNIYENKPIKVTDFAIKNLNMIGHNLYFISMLENRGIYKLDVKSMQMKKIVEGNVDYLTVTDDNMYYYKETHTGKLCSNTLDGSNEKVLIEEDVIEPIIKGSYVYYISPENEGCIYKMNLKTLKSKKISEKYTRCMNINDSYIYYSNFKGMYRMDLDGNHLVKLSDDQHIKNILVGETGVYCFKDNYIMWIRNDGEVINRYDIDQYFMSLGIIDNKINILRHNSQEYSQVYHLDTRIVEDLDIEYKKIEAINYPYVVYCNDKYELMIYNIESREKIYITDEYEQAWIRDNDLFYIGNRDRICKSSLDGENITILTNQDEAYTGKIFEDGIYYIQYKDEGYKYLKYIDFSGKDKKVILDEMEYGFSDNLFLVKDDYIYYYKDKEIYRIKKDGTEKTLITKTKKNVYEMFISDDKLVYRDGHDMYGINLRDLSVKPFIYGLQKILEVDGEYAYFIKDNLYDNIDTLCRYHLRYFTIDVLAEAKEIKVAKGYNDKVVYQAGNEIYELDLKTKENKLIIKNVSNKPYIDENKIYVKIYNDKVHLLELNFIDK